MGIKLARSKGTEVIYRGSPETADSTLGYRSPLTFERQWAATAAGASRPIEGLPRHQASPVGATRTRGAAISVSPQSTWAAPITGLAGILEVASLIPSEPQCSAP